MSKAWEKSIQSSLKTKSAPAPQTKSRAVSAERGDDAICHAPYNFVPLSGQVRLATEQECAAARQDLPRADGICGHLDLELWADGALLVGGKQSLQDGSKHIQFFQTPDEKYAIPGSAVRGMLRNLLKIVMLGKLNQLDDKRLAIRDLTSALKEKYLRAFSNEPLPRVYASKVRSGWLSFDNGKWYLRPCRMARVERMPGRGRVEDSLWGYCNAGRTKPETDKAYLNTPFGRDFYEWKKDALHAKRMTLGEVYHSLKKLLPANSSHPLPSLQFTPGAEADHAHSGKRLRYRKALNLGSGTQRGHLVMSAHPGANKHMEFIFFDEDGQEPPFEVGEQQFQVFREAYQASDAWQFWMGALPKTKRIPVFYLQEQEGGKQRLYLGFSQLFKLPAKLSLHEAVRNSSDQHLDEAADMVDLLFGRVLPEQAGAQAWAGKGRVDFSLARLQNPEQAEEQAWRILPGAPKPSYYPNYVEQSEKKDRNGHLIWRSLLDQDARLRGWKRYQVKQFDEEMLREIEGKIKKLDVEQQQKQSCTLHFIKPKAQQALRFTLRMRFHNLSPFELGALIWALRWGGDDSCYHSLGMGKPYGAGAVQLKILGQCWRENAKLEQGWQTGNRDWMQEFTRHMQAWWAANGLLLPSLYALARKKRKLPQYRYMRLEMKAGDTGRPVNEFQDAKKEDKFLQRPQEEKDGK